MCSARESCTSGALCVLLLSEMGISMLPSQAFNETARPFPDRHQSQLPDVLRNGPPHGVYLGRYNFNNANGRKGRPQFGPRPPSAVGKRNPADDPRFEEPNALRQSLLRSRLEHCELEPSELAHYSPKCIQSDSRAVALLHIARQSVDTSRWWIMRWPQNAASLFGRAGALSPGRTYKLTRALRKRAPNYPGRL